VKQAEIVGEVEIGLEHVAERGRGAALQQRAHQFRPGCELLGAERMQVHATAPLRNLKRGLRNGPFTFQSYQPKYTAAFSIG
jgi:hypothetical protein